MKRADCRYLTHNAYILLALGAHRDVVGAQDKLAARANPFFWRPATDGAKAAALHQASLLARPRRSEQAASEQVAQWIDAAGLEVEQARTVDAHHRQLESLVLLGLHAKHTYLDTVGLRAERRARSIGDVITARHE